MVQLYSYNGWAAATKLPLDNRVVPGTAGVKMAPGLLAGDVADVLFYYFGQYHRRVEPLDLPGPADEWGFAFRTNRNANNLSCHASATAGDANATRHPNKKRGSLTAAQIAVLRAIQAEVNGVVKWGGDFFGTPDWMHHEIHGTKAQVAAVARRLREAAGAGGDDAVALNPDVHEVPPTPPAPRDALSDGILERGESGPAVLAWQGELWRLGYGVGLHDGQFGPAVEAATGDFQAAAGIARDHKAGPQTFERARAVPTYPKASGPALPLFARGGDRATVLAFQLRLQARGWAIVPDGIYGDRSQSITTQFQRQVGLVPDGVGGPAVWTALWLRPVT